MDSESIDTPIGNSNKLGIYIPTQNRPKELEECIESFIPQLRPYKFPIYIYDTSDNDNILFILKRLKSKYPYIIYRHTNRPEVYSTAGLKVLSMGNTQYIWMFGDDDKLAPGAIDRIVKELDKGFEYLQINNQPFTYDFSKKAGKAPIECIKDHIYKPGQHEDALLTAKNGYGGYLAVLIIERKRYEAILKSANYIDRYFIPNMLFFKAIVGARGKLIAKPLVKYRTGATNISSKVMEIWFKNYPTSLRFLKPDYSEKCLKKAERKDWLLLFLIQTKARMLKYLSSHKVQG